jgi:protoporphyrinogen oxidase
MGAGIADLFMRPYNFKVWAYPTTMMQAEWLGERVATVDANRAIRNVLESRVEDSWGPNAVFRFPVRGGTGAMWKAVASILPADRIKYNKSVISIDADNKLVKCSDGATIRYK